MARELWSADSVVVAHGLVALQHVASSRTRARTRVSCIGRRILNHCATRETHINIFYIAVSFSEIVLITTKQFSIHYFSSSFIE